MEVKEETKLEDILKDILDDYDFILVEGYKNSNLRKIEIYDKNLSKNIITDKELLICVATHDLDDFKLRKINVIKKDDFFALTDIIEKESLFPIEKFRE